MKVAREKNKIHFNYLDRAYAIISLEENHTISIDIIRVEAPFRRHGIASMIVTEILNYIKSFFSNIKKVVLSPLPLDTNGAKLAHLINFYKKFGFMLNQSEDRSKPYLMTKHL